MVGMEILNVATGLVLVFFLFRLLTAAIREGIEGIIKSRAVHFEQKLALGGNSLSAYRCEGFVIDYEHK